MSRLEAGNARSRCDKQIQQHEDVVQLRRHEPVAPAQNQENLCCRQEPMVAEMFCCSFSSKSLQTVTEVDHGGVLVVVVVGPHKHISRSESESVFGCMISPAKPSSKVGVSLDPKSGILAF